MTRTWKIWVFSVLGLGVLVACTVAVVSWNNVASAWRVEAADAQYALNHTPLVRLQTHQVFTAAGVQQVFYGEDAFHQAGYAFVYGNPLTATYVPASTVVTKGAALRDLRSEQIRAVTETLGLLTAAAQTTLGTRAGVVWEVYGFTHDGVPEYDYLNASNGQLIWKYVL